MFLIFSKGYEESSIAIISYAFSAYTLMITLFSLWKRRKMMTALREKAFKAAELRRKYGLMLSVIFNGLYIMTKSIAGLVFHSQWLIALALYYLIVFQMKLILVLTKETWKNTPIIIGSALIISTLPLTAIARALVRRSFAFSYPGYLIYVFALYSFAFLSTAVYGFIRRKNGNLKEKCCRTLSLSLAAVTLLTLQSAMFSSFSPNENPLFEKRMHAILSLSVVIAVALLGIYLIREGTKKPAMKDRF